MIIRKRRVGGMRSAAVGFLVGLFILFIPSVACGQVEVMAERDSVDIGRISLTGYPFIFYTPETDFAYGGALIVTGRLSESAGSKPSSAMLSGWTSTLHSYLLALSPEFFLSDDRIYASMGLRVFRTVDKFWGIGNDTRDTIDANHTRNGVTFNIEVDLSVLGPLKLGLNYDLSKTTMADRGSNPFLLSGSVRGSDGGFTSGLGAVFFVDTRNSAFYPTAGGYYKLSFLNAASWLGSGFTFSRWILDLRHYIAVSRPITLAVQMYASAVTEDIPFYMLPALGGGKVMRGYYEGRYRDKMYMALQGEVRVRLFGRWGIVGWAGLGDVAGGAGDFKLKSAKPSFGVGVRFALDPVEILNIRTDFARGRGSKGVYFDAKEAF